MIHVIICIVFALVTAEAIFRAVLHIKIIQYIKHERSQDFPYQHGGVQIAMNDRTNYGGYPQVYPTIPSQNTPTYSKI